MTRIVLGSASPRRRALLAEAGVTFDVLVSDVDENLPPGIDPVEAARVLAERKARAVVARLKQDPPAVVARAGGTQTLDTPAADEVVVLAADTIVAVEQGGRHELLGKPGDEREAAQMLRSISGTRHQVVTGVCVLAERAGSAPQLGHERTWVTMRAITDDEVRAYVASGEWRDKAGGYAIQESADRFVERLEEGGFDNVVGLPVRLALELLARAGALVAR